jgi:predicted amino acid dehydrogenase
MRLSAFAIGAFLVIASSSIFPAVEGFTARPHSLNTRLDSSNTGTRSSSAWSVEPQWIGSNRHFARSPLQMSYSVGIVGATGAVGKEIRQCLESRGFPVSKLRIFGSERSAGKTVTTANYGDVKVELFDVAKARECDVVFLAVSGDFALEHAEAISAGDDGAVVIDNSVSYSSTDTDLVGTHCHFGLYVTHDSCFCFNLPLFIKYCSPHFVTDLKFLWSSPRSMEKKPKNPN